MTGLKTMVVDADNDKNVYTNLLKLKYALIKIA